MGPRRYGGASPSARVMKGRVADRRATSTNPHASNAEAMPVHAKAAASGRSRLDRVRLDEPGAAPAGVLHGAIDQRA